jgi:hypothetical protein
LVHKREQTDLTEAQVELALEQRIDGQQQGRREIVNHMAKGDRAQNRKRPGVRPLADNRISHGKTKSLLSVADIARNG